jgi:RNA polymerase sigma-70 factor (ECF subfamily)
LKDEFTGGLLKLIPKLRVHALALTHNRTAAEDLVQDTIVSALSARESFNPGTNLSAWAHTILRNRFISTVRRRREMVELEDAPEAAFAATGAQEDRLVLKELARALAQLAPEQREALIMAVVLGLSYEEIAAAMRCSEGTAKSRVFRARRQLKAMLLGEAERTNPTLEHRGGHSGSRSAKHEVLHSAQ